jgi:hypothetical protein
MPKPADPGPTSVSVPSSPPFHISMSDVLLALVAKAVLLAIPVVPAAKAALSAELL